MKNGKSSGVDGAGVVKEMRTTVRGVRVLVELSRDAGGELYLTASENDRPVSWERIYADAWGHRRFADAVRRYAWIAAAAA